MRTQRVSHPSTRWYGADHLWECRVGVRAAALSTGFCACCLVPVDGLETWILSSGHRVCAACAHMESRTLTTHLEDPVPSSLCCSRALHRPYKFCLDGQARCGTCSTPLPSGGTLFEDMVARLVLVWLDLCHSPWPAKFMAAGQLFPRKLGRRLASACVSELHQHDMPAADARLRCVVSLRRSRQSHCAGSTTTVSVHYSIATLASGPRACLPSAGSSAMMTLLPSMRARFRLQCRCRSRAPVFSPAPPSRTLRCVL